jgi:hypothetical protein
MSSPKEVLFFKVIADELVRRGHTISYTTRKYSGTQELIDMCGIPAESFGRHGQNLQEKLFFSIERLNKLVKRFEFEKVNGLITLMNPEVCRIAFGLKIPVFNFSDLIEADAVARLTLPLSRITFIPFHVPVVDVRRYYDGEIFSYDCLDPVAWMPKTPSPRDSHMLPDVVRDNKHPLIIYRQAETRASYFQGFYDFTPTVIDILKRKVPGLTFYGLSRYTKHKTVDVQSLLYYADLFIGGGGTMGEEASWWGTWNLSCRPFIATYDRWQIDNGLMWQPPTVRESVIMVLKLLKLRGKNPQRKLIRKQKFPLKEICDAIERGAQ